MTLHVGVIAEDLSDIAVIEAIIKKSTKRRFAIKHFIGHGCGKIMGKCRAWAHNLRMRGCTLLILVQDLDRRSLPLLAPELSSALLPTPIPKHVIVIPVREIEAWLLADEDAVGAAVKARRQVKHIANPESLADPKKTLRDVIYAATDRRTVYVNTVHNPRIAQHARLPKLRRCPSFEPLDKFISNYM